jgi:hypothetical protein
LRADKFDLAQKITRAAAENCGRLGNCRLPKMQTICARSKIPSAQGAMVAADEQLRVARRNRMEPIMATLEHVIPSAKDLQKRLALAEAEKAADYARRKVAEDAEKKALLDQLSKPSGVSDDERMKRAVTIIERAAGNGLTEVMVGRFPNQVFTDRGRAINQAEAGWETTLTGLPKELYDFWAGHLRQHGYRIKYQVVDFPGGMPGDIGITLSWG